MPKEEIAKSKVRQQVRTLGLLLSILLGIIYYPALKMVPSLLTHPKSFRVGRVLITTPQNWSSRTVPPKLEIWKGCLTVFCKAPRASITVEAVNISDETEAWERAARAVLHERGFNDSVPFKLSSEAGRTECIESSRPLSTEVISTCKNSTSAFAATFMGERSFLHVFHSILQDAKL